MNTRLHHRLEANRDSVASHGSVSRLQARIKSGATLMTCINGKYFFAAAILKCSRCTTPASLMPTFVLGATRLLPKYHHYLPQSENL